MIAVGFTLNKLSTDSELIVMNPPEWRRGGSSSRSRGRYRGVTRGLRHQHVRVTQSLRELRRWATEVRAEVVTNNVTPGRFASSTAA